MRVKKDIPAPKVSRPAPPPRTEAPRAPSSPATTTTNVSFDKQPGKAPSGTAAHRIHQTK